MDESIKFINNSNKIKNIEDRYKIIPIDEIIYNTIDDYKGKIIKNKKKYSLKLINFCLLFCFFFFCKITNIRHLDNNFKKLLIYNINQTEEKNIIENFYKLSEKGILFHKMREKRISNPKISIIIPIHNNENNIKRIITSIKNQSYKDIEIIFVDDASTDNSIKEIEKYKRRDKRIKIIKHNIKEGSFISRNDGVLNAKGQYILFIESNGILIGDILKKLFGAIEIYETDIIKFDSFYIENNIFEKYDFDYYLKRNTIIYQPDILKLAFYPYEGELYQHNLNLWGKIIKKELYIKVLNNLRDYYKKQNWNLYEDNAMYFILLKNAETYIYVSEIGYINGPKDKIDNNENNNEIINDLFLLAEIIFDFTEDNIYEKTMANYQIRRIFYDYKKNLEIITEGFDKYYFILSKFSNCKSIIEKQQYYVNQVRNILNKAELKK